MPKCIPCLGSRIKEILKEAMPELSAELEKIADCDNYTDISLCARGAKGSKRGKSAYNVFISTCMKKKDIKGTGKAPIAMTQCAAEWRKSKGG